MKHHKVKGVWRLRPDEIPVPDASCMGAKLAGKPRRGIKHLWDKTKASYKELKVDATSVVRTGLPDADWFRTSTRAGDWRWYMGPSTCERLEAECDRLDGLIAQIQQRSL